MKKLTFLIVTFLFCFNNSNAQTIEQELNAVRNLNDAKLLVKAKPDLNIKYKSINSGNILSEKEKSIINSDFTRAFIIDNYWYKWVSQKTFVGSRVQYIYLDGSKLSQKEIERLRSKIIQEYQENPTKNNFTRLVNQYTMDGVPDGDLGWFDASLMVKEFSKAILNYKKGDVFKVDVPDNQWHYVVLKSEDEKEVTNFVFLSVQEERTTKPTKFTDGWKPVDLWGKWGFWDSKEDIVIDIKYDKVGKYFNSENHTFVKENNHFYVIDYVGNKTSDDYDSIYMIGDYFIFVDNDLHGIGSLKGQIMVKPQFQAVGSCRDGVFTIKKDNKWGNWIDGSLNFNNPILFVDHPDQKPVFVKACLHMKNEKTIQECSYGYMMQTIYRNIKYPAEARKKGIQGIVKVAFVVTPEGKLTDVKIIASPDEILSKEALRVVNENFNNWASPAIHDGQKMNASLVLPFSFRLN